jgi:tRNA uridine 5-carboxymethylaminomethyl modification enzyme
LVAGIELNAPSSWAQILRRDDVDAEHVASEIEALARLPSEDRRVVVGLLRYDGYLARQERERDRLRRLRHVAIPDDLNLASVPGISREVAEAMAADRPRTLADAEHVPGMTPAAIAILAGVLARRGRASR